MTVVKKPWADGPFPLITTPTHANNNDVKTRDRYATVADYMVVVHNIIIRGLNSIYLQAPHVKPDDYAAFIGYSICWSEFVQFHHDGEETIIFPGIDAGAGEKGVMDANVHQHEEFHPGLEAYKKYLIEAQKAPKTFSGTRLCEIIDSFAPILTAHLAAEIPTLLALSRYGDKIDIVELWDKDGKAATSTMGKTTSLAFFFLNLDCTFEGGKWAAWPDELPAPVRWVFTHICTWPNRAYWKFASCDYSGIPQDLHAIEG